MYRYMSRTPEIINTLKIYVRDFKDVPQIQSEKLSPDQVKSALDIHTLQWKVSAESTKLTKEFRFNDFKQTFAFMSSIATLVDNMQHFPKWSQKGNIVWVETTSNECKGITAKDILLAYSMENVAQDIINNKIDSICSTPKVMESQLLQSWNSNFSKHGDLVQNLQRTTTQL